MNLSIVPFDTILLWVFGVNFLVALMLDRSAVGRERFSSTQEDQFLPSLPDQDSTPGQ